jgi:clan AA aspartic protease (TIGR02281 family)
MYWMGVFLAALCSVVTAVAGEMVQWTDEQGQLHFSDSMASVPPLHRGHAKLKMVPDEASPKRVLPETTRSMPEASGERQTLPSYEVPFEAYEGDARRVIVSVTFNDSVTAPMIIDTGAPGLVISNRLAKRLGVFGRDDGMVVTIAGGIGGQTPAMRTFIDKVQVGGARDSLIPATVVSQMSPAYEGLIGMDFMSKYSFNIDPAKQVVVFQELSPNPHSPAGRDERWWRGLFREFHSLRTAWNNYASQPKINPQTKEFALRQVGEVDKLLSKLERHASQNSVPQAWR